MKNENTNTIPTVKSFSQLKKALKPGMRFEISDHCRPECIGELVMQVFLNLVSNALRYADSRVECSAYVSEDEMTIIVADDGKGFSEEAIRKAWQPFYRAGNDNDKEHFGLGLYICKLLCRKNGGDIMIENNENGGGKVTAKFSVKNTGI